ncbi:ABC transporter substrate-binding protein [Paeniglutamicibacter gangotriensis]|uniref:Glutamine ABC transporter substrate-binding protein n=2 Tax=Paeniglutamicibacter gangotriensis TaxID=254787 RepID=M7NBZ4_9MICC|nr:ABC transporter substrate-binding protein [Paeniglutamicibacter gangotriensis]EMQ99314.1 glutamine ABC transporter substrate-binding protein [Paeniglutamicibacter gangotriensis Lz1y]KAA0977602.1 ABC transporter substrate-binding protein [Paeniglutamicibacter gangotriensis]
MISHRTARFLAAGMLLALATTGCTTVSEAETAQGSDTQGSDTPAAESAATLGINEAARALLPAEVRDRGVLTIASDPTYPPFEYYDTDNKTIIGWDADMGDALGAVLGVKVKHVPATFDTILPGLQSGKYDLGMSTFSVTPERRKAVDFVPYLQGGTAVAVAPGNPEKLSVASETLCGKAIAAQKGSIQSLDILPEFSKECTEAGSAAIDMQFFPTQNDANLALTSGRVQGVMADSVSLAYQGELADGKFEVADGPDYEPELTGTALGKGSELLPAIQAATVAVIESPAYQEINTKWALPASTEITPADVVLK